MSYLHLDETPGAATEHDRAFGWAGRLPRIVGGLLLGLLLTGLSARVLRFGGFVQWSLLAHVVVGLAAVVPISVYAARHWGFYRREGRALPKALGNVTLAVVLMAAATGLWITVRAILGQHVAATDRRLHLAFSIAAVVFTLAHLLPVWLRRPRRAAEVPRFLAARRGYVAAAAALGALVVVLAIPGTLLHRGPATVGAFPAGYAMPGGAGKPFAPALATTESGLPIGLAALSGSVACGSPRCHPTIYREWEVSAHRWSGSDVVFRKVAEQVSARRGRESLRTCSGCHEPVALLSAAASPKSSAGEEGVSCVACHSIRTAASSGNGYVVQAPARYLFEGSSGSGSLISSFLIRAYPEQHRRSFGDPGLATSELCASCHRQSVEEPAGAAGLLRIQNQYEQWRRSRWSHDADGKGPVACGECHMPLLEGVDAVVGTGRGAKDLEGRHRSHRFLGANGSMPVLLGIPGGEIQATMTEQWLHGEYPIPEIADRWDKGPIVTLTLQAPETAVAGQPVDLAATVTSRKVGHAYPTGALDLSQAWLEIEARDPSGKLVFSSGDLDARQSLEPDTIVFGEAAGDPAAAPRAELASLRRSPGVAPGESRTESFGFSCPAAPGRPATLRKLHVPLSAAGYLSVSARLRYRKLDPGLLEAALPGKGASAPVVDVARASARIAVYAPR
jgi:hypothetical protein